MIIDAWMQHPNADWIGNPMFESLRRWRPGKWSETAPPIEDTLAEVGAKTLEWDAQTAAKYRSDLEAKGMVFIEAKDGLDIPAFQKAVLAQVNKDFPEWTNYIQQIQAVK